MLVRHPSRRNVYYQVTREMYERLIIVHERDGLRALNHALDRMLPYFGEIDPGEIVGIPNVRNEPVEEAEGTGRADHPLEFFNTYLMAKKKPKTEEDMPATETLTTPIIPETNEDGTKRLYKTRYTELEKKYVTLYSQHQAKSRALQNARTTEQKNTKEIHSLQIKLEEQSALTIEGKKVDTLLNRMCKELNIDFPEEFRIVPLEERLERFLGTLLCRIRTEVVVDELAD